MPWHFNHFHGFLVVQVLLWKTRLENAIFSMLSAIFSKISLLSIDPWTWVTWTFSLVVVGFTLLNFKSLATKVTCPNCWAANLPAQICFSNMLNSFGNINRRMTKCCDTFRVFEDVVYWLVSMQAAACSNFSCCIHSPLSPELDMPTIFQLQLIVSFGTQFGHRSARIIKKSSLLMVIKIKTNWLLRSSIHCRASGSLVPAVLQHQWCNVAL